jgi:thiamine-monophosphate kinase
VSPTDGERLLREQPVPRITLFKVGECIDAGLWLDTDGVRTKLDPVGWVHQL